MTAQELRDAGWFCAPEMAPGDMFCHRGMASIQVDAYLKFYAVRFGGEWKNVREKSMEGMCSHVLPNGQTVREWALTPVSP